VVLAPAIVLAALVLSLTAYCWWVHHRINVPAVSGDMWYMRQFAFTDQPITAPYRWRPLLPWLARWFGFNTVTFTANALTPFVIFYYAGAGWVGFCCALIFIGNAHIFQFNIKAPEYAEGLGHFLFASTIFAMSLGHWSAYPLALLCAMTRETITAALGLICVFINPLIMVPLAVGSVIAWFARTEDKDNRHPLIEGTYVGTVTRWARTKGWRALHFAHTILPLRATPFAVPLMWGGVNDFARLGVLGFIPIWLLALPASGQSRIICYGYVLVVPFLAAIPLGWLAAVTMLCCFWPVDWQVFDESGGDSTFAVVR